MRITHLVIKNFQGIEALDTKVSPSGAVVAGRNGGGKTSVIRALQAALAARGVDPTAIRVGAERAEVLVDLDDITVRRVITPRDSSVTVMNSEGFERKKPATFLSEIVGTAAVDPVELFLAPAKERRKQILAALPVKVSLEDLRKWAPTLPDNFDCSGHGLDVIERVRKLAYDKRTTANADAKAKRADADRVRDEAKAAANNIPSVLLSLAAATAEADRTKAEHAALVARATEVRSASARAEGQRVKASRLRAEADEMAIPAVDQEAFARDDAAWTEAVARVSRLRAELDDAERAERTCRDRVADHNARRDAAETIRKRADELRAQAQSIEETIGSIASTGPTDDEIEAARLAVEKAIADGALALRAEEAAKVAERAKELDVAAVAAEKEATRLDDMVKALSNDAPAALLATANAIPGLSLDGDNIMLDGKSIDRLSGKEQLRFAVEIAKRMNTKTRVLLCDGLERLDPEQMDSFIEFATDGGWQLLATRVDRGDVRIEAIEREVAEAAE